MAATTTVPLVIDGQDYTPEKSFDIKAPATGQVVYKSGGASVADAVKAVDAAAEALKTWRKTTPHERQDLLLKAADIMSRRRDELAKYLVDETGSAAGWADFNVNNAVRMLKDVAGRIPSLAGSFPATADPNRSAIILREPYGVVLSIAPWYGCPSSPESEHMLCRLRLTLRMQERPVYSRHQSGCIPHRCRKHGRL